MLRKIIQIDQEKCNGCSLCVSACHEGAIGLIDRKARLLRDDYCDGLGDCLPVCPTDAISFETRQAQEFNKEAVLANMREKAAAPSGCESASGCPGVRAAVLKPQKNQPAGDSRATAGFQSLPSELNHWPVQLQLAPVTAPYYENARLLISADCAAYAHGDFHRRFMKGHVTLIGCPKLDHAAYAEKLTEILRRNAIRSVTVVRMEVPCCGGLENAAVTALRECGKMIPWQAVTLSTRGDVMDI